MSNSELTKVAVCYNGDEKLCKIQKELGLSAAIKKIKEKFLLPAGIDYGLKTDEKNSQYRYYVTEKTFGDVKDGEFLEITDSVGHKLKVIFKYIDDKHNSPKSCKELYDISHDPAFIEKLVQREKEYALMDFIKLDLIEEGMIGCLKTTSELIKRQYIASIDQSIICNLARIVCSHKQSTQYALNVLAQILYSKNSDFENTQMHILKELPVQQLLYFFKLRGNLEIQYNALLVLNAFIRKNKDDSRKALINELNTKPNRELMFRMMIEQTISTEMAGLLAIYQSYLLAQYRSILNKCIPLQSLDFDTIQQHRMSDDMSMLQFNMGSVENLDTHSYKSSMDNISRYSLSSLGTRNSIASDTNLYDASYMSLLGHHCITYYRDRYNGNFSKSQAEENTYEPGICKSADRVIAIIADVLNFNGRIQRNNKRYVPLYFNPETNFFIEEIFVKMMFLLSQTRKEMKVKKIDDYEKVIDVLKKHLSLILDKKPNSFKEFKLHLQDITYEQVRKERNEERNKEWKRMVATNPCLIEAYQQIKKENEVVINEHRMGVLMKGDLFPMLPEKKFKNRFNKLMISKNTNLIYFGEWKINENCFEEKQTLYLNQLSYIITGKACPHIKDGSYPESKLDCAFSLHFGETVINCMAKDPSTANYWIDGFRIIACQSERSTTYLSDLEEISQMDFEMRLIELQNIKIPMEAPPVPSDVDLPDFPRECDEIDGVDENPPPPMIYRKQSIRSNTMYATNLKPTVPRKINAKQIRSVQF